MGLLAVGAFGILLATKAAQWGWERTWFTGWLIALICLGIGGLSALLLFMPAFSRGAWPPLEVMATIVVIAVGLWWWGGALLRLRRNQERALYALLQSQGRSTVDLRRE